MLLAIAGRDLRSLFYSPLAWSLAGVMQFLLAWIFLLQVEGFLEIQSRLANLPNPPGVTDQIAIPTINTAATIIMLLLPLLSMRSFSEAYRNGTFGLLQSAPVSLWHIVLGKYLALLLTLAPMILLTALTVLSLQLGSSLDTGRILAALLGLTLITATHAAIGILLSSLTRQPAVAAVATYGALLFLWFMAIGSETGGLTTLSTTFHFNTMLSGLVSSNNLLYFLLLIILSLSLTVNRLDSQRVLGR
ncbi:MAG: ABC transporter permease subunit [Gammaproteobacteria bacterium]|nr:ABC transporter permease subunit [Gammaproteobacteria bacterium]